MPRVIAGQAKGKMLKVQGKDVRPTTDRIRQALFNTLEHRFYITFESSKVLDLYAGTGALGLEAMSRGASHITWVEFDGKTVRTLKQNIQVVTESVIAHTTVLSMKAETFISKVSSSPFDLIFVDPPYHLKKGPYILDHLHPSLFHPNTLVVIEHDKRDIFEVPITWSQKFIRKYSDTLISIYQVASE